MKKTLLGLCIASVFAAQTSYALELKAWVIDGDSEKPYFQQLEKTFNAKYKDQNITVDVVPIPGYNNAIQAAALSGELPDVIMVDGPNMANYVWTKMLQPMDGLLDKTIVADLLPSVKEQGIYGPDQKIYMISPYDSSVLLWGNKKYLKAAGVRIPAGIKDAWSEKEFVDALAKLSKVKGVQWPLDMKLNYDGEWYTYGFAPFIQSRGADLIDRKAWKAEGTIDSPAAVDALAELQTWSKNGWIVPATAGDNRFYGDKTAALAWVGNWMWRAHKTGLDDDLVLIPAPKLGVKSVSPNGGWGWAVPAKTKHTAEVAKFLNFALSTEQVAKYADITGYIPSRKSSVALSEIYRPGGEGALFVEQAQSAAMVRPVHPAYPVISNSFGKAVQHILQGADVKGELQKAAATIDEDIEDNSGYPPFNK